MISLATARLTLSLCLAIATPASAKADGTGNIAVGPQYGSTHAYIAPDQVDRLVTSLIATFGGQASPPANVNVTPVPSLTISRVVSTPVGLLSVFGFKTPIPYPFGEERTGYLVTDVDAAVAAARRAGAEIVVSPYPDAIGRDANIRWPGGVTMQLYSHTKAPSYPPLASIPDNRAYLSGDQADAFIRDFMAFSGAQVITDDPRAPGIEIGRPGDAYRRVHIVSAFGNLTVLVTDGHLPWPYGREVTGYEAANFAATLSKATSAGVEILAGPYGSGAHDAAMVRFPGGYIAEIHAPRSD